MKIVAQGPINIVLNSYRIKDFKAPLHVVSNLKPCGPEKGHILNISIILRVIDTLGSLPFDRQKYIEHRMPYISHLWE